MVYHNTFSMLRLWVIVKSYKERLNKSVIQTVVAFSKFITLVCAVNILKSTLLRKVY